MNLQRVPLWLTCLEFALIAVLGVLAIRVGSTAAAVSTAQVETSKLIADRVRGLPEDARGVTRGTALGD
jgi:hypothetical protein